MICTHNNKHTYTVRTHKKTEGFTLPHATAVIVDKFSFFFHVLVEDWSYTISTFYRIEIGQKLGLPGQCRKKVEIKSCCVACCKIGCWNSSLLTWRNKYVHDDILCLFDDEWSVFICVPLITNTHTQYTHTPKLLASLYTALKT